MPSLNQVLFACWDIKQVQKNCSWYSTSRKKWLFYPFLSERNSKIEATLDGTYLGGYAAVGQFPSFQDRQWWWTFPEPLWWSGCPISSSWHYPYRLLKWGWSAPDASQGLRAWCVGWRAWSAWCCVSVFAPPAQRQSVVARCRQSISFGITSYLKLAQCKRSMRRNDSIDVSNITRKQVWLID